MAGRDAGRRRLSTRRAYRALAQRMRQCSQQRWFQRGGASFGRCVQAAGDAQAKRTVAARACQQPGVRALRASARAFAPMLATALVSASRWWILSEAREASDGGDGPCWVIGGGGGVRRLRGRQAVASGDGGCTGWLRRAEQRCTSERQTRQCEWSVRAGGRCWPATAAASGMAAAAAAARATATCAVECGDNNGRGLAGAGRRRRRRLAAATRRRRRDGGDATAAMRRRRNGGGDERRACDGGVTAAATSGGHVRCDGTSGAMVAVDRMALHCMRACQRGACMVGSEHEWSVGRALTACGRAKGARWEKVRSASNGAG